ncbi:hypothetical protein VTH06DRAFT_4721 [Thermothelomyces fergusii]
MAPRQHTFTLVPNPLGMQGLMSRPTKGPQCKPPMTSKQAQKLYREATRVPRLSKVEQRRLEREEQERIRRELAHEKQLNRARVLRERKKAKEQQALEERRRKGLPLVDVRPSQDTIARFVRGNGAGKKRDAAGERVDIPAVQAEAAGTGSGAGGLSSREEQPSEDMNPSEGKKRRAEQDPRGEEERQDRVPQTAAGVKGVEGPSAVTALGRAEKCISTAEANVSVSRDLSAAASVSSSAGAVRVPVSVAKSSAGGDGRASASAQAELRNEPRLEQQRAGNSASAATPSEDVNPTLECRPRSTGTTVLDKSSEAVGGKSQGKGVMTKPPVVPPIRQDTPSRNLKIARVEGAAARAPNPQSKQPVMSPTPEKLPVSKPSQIVNPSPRTGFQQQQQQKQTEHKRHPSRPPQAQVVPTRRVLQETTNSSNWKRPAPVTSGASKFAPPYKHTIAPPQRQSCPNGPAFRQTRPNNPPAGAVQKPQFLPAHLRNAATQNQPASQTSALKAQSRSPQVDFLSEPPTSTQLFIMAHLDELFPSPTQEAREIQGDSPPVVSKPARPDTERPAITAFAPDRSKHLVQQQVTHVQEPMAPPPRPATGTQPAQTKGISRKPAPVPEPNEAFELSFLSTQDLIFSSQDLRELDEPTNSTGTVNPRSNDRPPPRKQETPAPQRPSLSSHSPSGGTTNQSVPLHQAKHLDPTTRRYPNPGCAARQLPGNAGGSANSSTPARVVERKPALESNKYVPPLDNKRPPLEGQMRIPSPEKPRFFGSSGEGMVELALKQSIKTYQEEEKRRRCERKVQQETAMTSAVSTGRGLDKQKGSPPLKPENQTRQDATSGREYKHDTLLQRKPSTTNNNNTNSGASSNTRRENTASMPPSIPTASQETDYGDAELDSMDLELLFATTG